jgi:ATP-dependent Lon protease
MEHINNELNVITVEKRIRGRVKTKWKKTQKAILFNMNK